MLHHEKTVLPKGKHRGAGFIPMNPAFYHAGRTILTDLSLKSEAQPQIRLFSDSGSKRCMTLAGKVMNSLFP